MEGKEREGEEGGGVGIISASADFQALSYMFYMCFLIQLSELGDSIEEESRVGEK